MGRRSANLLRGPALPALVCLALVGCGGCDRDPAAYPDGFQYPPREEWLVVVLPKEAPAELEPAGQLEEGIRRINDRGGQALDPAAIPESLRTELNTFLRQTFGTPAAPTVGGDPEMQARAVELGLTDERLADGSKLFRKHCQECHGPTGNGRGPTAPWITPHPRDFRQGVFKFVSTQGTGPRKPTRADLFATLTHGLPTTQMPSFALRSEDERHQLIDYVIFLSVRGRTEFAVLRALLQHGPDGLDADVATDAGRIAAAELQAWAKAEADVLPAAPPALPDDAPDRAESVRRGHALFLDEKGGACATCHVNYGREGKLQYDVWGTRVKPADLTDNRKKAGTDAASLYRRLRGGIGPSNMPAAIGLSESQTWDVVHFLQALPYPDRLPDDVKARVYPAGQ